jgi:biofilm protein TabA
VVIDKIANVKFYTGLEPTIAKGLALLKDIDFHSVSDGKYAIDGDDLFYIVERSETKPFRAGKLEAHQKYIDIQYLVSGEEVLAHSLLDNLHILDSYNNEKDVAFYQLPEKVTTLYLLPGMFCIFFPHDAHLPMRFLEQKQQVLKVVMKIKCPTQRNFE